MARAESKTIMGYLPIEERHYPALLSLVAPAHSDIRLLDPFAGEGEFLESAANAWRLTPYANEQDGQRATFVCTTRSAGGIDLMRANLDVDTWTRLITGGLSQGVIRLSPD